MDFGLWLVVINTVILRKRRGENGGAGGNRMKLRRRKVRDW